MNKIYRDITRHVWNGILRRNISRNAALNGEKKTTVHIMNQDADSGLMIDAFSEVGFRLNNGITVIGPMAVFRRSVLSWNVGNLNDIHEKSLSLFTVLEPKLDILVIGIGDKVEDNNFQKKLILLSRKLKTSFEILPTEHACTTFNFLNSEGRNVAAVLIPPKHFVTSIDDEIQSRIRYQTIYEKD